MTPTPEQDRALTAISSWLDDGDKPFFSLQGLAGTGKTSVAVHLAGTLNRPIYPMAYTGKACSVLTKKGLPAKTLHSSIYLPVDGVSEEAEELEKQLETATPPEQRRILQRLEKLNSPSFVLREREGRFGANFHPDGVIICDEMSMVGPEEGKDLLSFGLPVLVLGDPGQLPPIQGRGYFNGRPDFLLTEIHRQALESPVIRLAMLAREGKALPSGSIGASLVTTRKKVTKELVVSCTQVVCGSNKVRNTLNQEIRGFFGFTGDLPKKDERLICLRNNPQQNLLNGQMIELSEDSCFNKSEKIVVKSTEGHKVLVHPECFEDPEQIKSWSYQRRKTANEFDYGYAVTAHKFQGSASPRVLVWADMFRWDRDMFKTWLYTAITRAEDSVVVAL